MVPVPESLMSPDYQDPVYDIQRSIQKVTPNNSYLSNSNTKETNDTNDKRTAINKNVRSSPKLTRSAMSSPKLRAKVERKGSLSNSSDTESKKSNSTINSKINGVAKHSDKSMSDDSENIAPEKLEVIKLASNQRRQKKQSAEAMAAVTIQKMWRGYRSRNLNKDTLRILHAIQAARARQHIELVYK